MIHFCTCFCKLQLVFYRLKIRCFLVIILLFYGIYRCITYWLKISFFRWRKQQVKGIHFISLSYYFFVSDHQFEKSNSVLNPNLRNIIPQCFICFIQASRGVWCLFFTQNNFIKENKSYKKENRNDCSPLLQSYFFKEKIQSIIRRKNLITKIFLASQNAVYFLTEVAITNLLSK